MRTSLRFPLLLAALAGSLALTSQAQTGQTLFPSSVSPKVVVANDALPVELGVRFYPKENGKITAIRFYRGTQGTGSFRVRLYDTNGAILGQANTFEGLPAALPGWASIAFSTPIVVEAGKIYVAAYYAEAGAYAYDNLYFLESGRYTPFLAAPPEGDLPDGGATTVYKYSPGGGFPTDTYLATNYWVDVSFTPDTPAITAFSDLNRIEVGTKFVVGKAGTINGVRFYRQDQGDGVFYAYLYDDTGRVLATALAGNGLPATLPGWATLTFAQNIPVEAGRTYTVSYFHAGGRYAFNLEYYAAPKVVGPLTYPVGAGVYRYGFLGEGMPTQSYQNSRYWVEPAYTPID
jgi:hypothetical protein